jgi:hypothetical protein
VDEDVYELHIGSIRSAQPASMAVMLLDKVRRTVYQNSFELASRERRDFRVNLVMA